FETESQGSYDAKPLLVSWASYKKYRRRDAEKTANNEVPTFFFHCRCFHRNIFLLQSMSQVAYPAFILFFHESIDHLIDITETI
ncbi:MAG: hypothetical protein OES33_11765, partial [Desulfobulbaceae bacterium]|nr:hypothetical protein [Desulfobulbaceae bacterium]